LVRMSRDKRLEELLKTFEDQADGASLYEMIKSFGYAPNRAKYIASGSPYGNSRKGMKRWLLEQKRSGGNTRH
jgi:hypothetical protein